MQDVLDSLQVKLGITAMTSFSLVVEHVKSLKRNKLTLLNPRDTLSKVGMQVIIKGTASQKVQIRVLFGVSFLGTYLCAFQKQQSSHLEVIHKNNE